MQPQYLYRATISKVVDGDTVDAVVELGFNVQALIRFRLYGINTQETNDLDPVKRVSGLKAKQFTTDKLLNKQVTLKSYKTDKYGRWLADIFVDGTPTSINTLIVQEGLAVEYFGGTRG